MTSAPATIDHNTLDREDEERRARLTGPAALTDAAHWYATVAGWPVFPLKPGGKTPATRNGFKDATVDPDQITAWWTATPQANIGTPTGITFDVIDIDGPEGFWSLADIRDANMLPDVLAKAYTGGGGRHLLVPPGVLGKNGARIMPGIDTRGAGGYIVLPPSRHETGRIYDWIDAPDTRLYRTATA